MEALVVNEMVRFFGRDVRRTGHALKVYAWAKTLAALEKLEPSVRETAVLAAILHDVGIKIAEERFGSCTFRQQEELGPPAAQEILSRLQIPGDRVERVCFLIAHHHTPHTTEDSDFRVLIEADFLVNLEEGFIPVSSAPSIAEEHFRTASGKAALMAMFG